MKETKLHTLYIRGVNKQVKNQLKKEAIKNGRSLNSEIIVRLNDSLVSKHLSFQKQTNS